MSLGNFLGSVGGAIGGLFGDAIGGTITGATLGSGLGSLGSALGAGIGLIGSGKGLYDSFNNTSLKNQMAYDQYRAELDYQYWSRKMSNRHTLEVGDLRQAGLNPILSANSAGSVASAIPNGSIPETSSQQSAAGAAREANRINAMIGETTSAKNLAEAQASIMNAETGRMVGIASARRSNAEAGLANTRSSNELAYPNNQPSLFKYINSGKQLVEDLFDRNYGLPSNASPARRQRYEVFINGVGRRQ